MAMIRVMMTRNLKGLKGLKGYSNIYNIFLRGYIYYSLRKKGFNPSTPSTLHKKSSYDVRRRRLGDDAARVVMRTTLLRTRALRPPRKAGFVGYSFLGAWKESQH